MARGQFILSVGDDNVVLTHFVNGQIKNAWIADPDPDLAHEELGEALATDKKADIGILVDTLDQTYQQDDLPKVGFLDRRKIVNRHMALEFAGQNLRGAKLIKENPNKTLTYQFVSIPNDGRLAGWINFVVSLPNELTGYFALATEAVTMLEQLTPEELEPVEEGNHWRHIIGVNVTGGFRQIIEKNGSMGFTRLTQAPPEDTPPPEFADNINRDFKATVTYIKRLGYVAGDTLDLVIITSPDIKESLSGLDWADTRSVTVLTPLEAAEKLDLGSIGNEDQAFCDILYAAWLANQRQPALKLSRAAVGDTYEDLRDLAFFLSPYAAGLAVAATVIYTGFAYFQASQLQEQQLALASQLNQARTIQTDTEQQNETLPFAADEMRSTFAVVESLESDQIDLTTDLQHIFEALDGDGVVISMDLLAQASGGRGPVTATVPYELNIRMQLDSLILTAEEALEVSRRIEARLRDNFDDNYEVEMTLEPTGAQAEESLSGDLLGGLGDSAAGSIEADEPFYAEYRVVRQS